MFYNKTKSSYLAVTFILLCLCFGFSSTVLGGLEEVSVNNVGRYNNITMLMATNPLFMISFKEKQITKINHLENKKVFALRSIYDYFKSKLAFERIIVDAVYVAEYFYCDCVENQINNFDAFIFQWSGIPDFIRSCLKDDNSLYDWNEFNIVNLNMSTNYIIWNNNMNNLPNSNQFNLEIIKYFQSLTGNNLTMNANLSLERPEVYNQLMSFSKAQFGIINDNHYQFLQYFISSSPINIYKNVNFTFQSLQNYFRLGNNFINTSSYLCLDSYSYNIYICSKRRELNNLIYLNDVPIFIVIFTGIIYFILLIPISKKISIKRRLILPYLSPLSIIIANLLLTACLSGRCKTVLQIIQLGLVAVIIATYGITLLRVVYLRNMYQLVRKSSENYIKIHKFCANPLTGIIATLFISFLYGMVWVILAIILKKTLSNTASDLGYGILYCLCLITGVVCGVVSLIIDILLNLSKIRKKGFRYFLFFDDPFYQRLDLIALSLMVIIVILVIIFMATGFSGAVSITRSIGFLFAFLISGGTAMFFEYWSFFYNKNSTTTEQEISGLEMNLKNESFLKLLRDYAEKEFSLENVLLFEDLILLQSKYNSDKVPLEEVQRIYDDYIRNLSKYEVNFPSKVRNEYTQLLHNGNTRYSFTSLKDLLYNDLLLNINDTSLRLEQTHEYKKWEELMKIQMKSFIVK
ncbi:hypothetical protein ABK040_007118 [Willaertia magna]